MNVIFKKQLQRRTFLRGAGGVMAGAADRPSDAMGAAWAAGNGAPAVCCAGEPASPAVMPITAAAVPAAAPSVTRGCLRAWR